MTVVPIWFRENEGCGQSPDRYLRMNETVRRSLSFHLILRRRWEQQRRLILKLRNIASRSRRPEAFDIRRVPARCRRFEKCGDDRRRNTFAFLLLPFSFSPPALVRANVSPAINASAP